VYSDAVHADNPERAAAQAVGVRILSYFGALGEVSAAHKTVAIAGTHGKTTTTALLTSVLKKCGENPTAIIGSLVPEFGSNFVPGEEPFIVEACEYYDHLLELTPEVLVITNLEWDHTDWFTSFEAMQETFRKAIEKVPASGCIITDPHHPHIAPLLRGARATVIDYTTETVPELTLLGEFNKMNARAAKAAARYLMSDIKFEGVDESLAAFTGTWRRFEKKGETAHGALVFDDYAHHPTAIKSTLEAVRKKFPEKRIVVALHPHLYSRTRDLMEDFAQSFDAADNVIIAPIYAAREAPIPGVSAEALVTKIGVNAIAATSLDDTLTHLKKYDTKDDIVITMGAGDIYKIAEKLV
jgi:UDP-N-acetylmuramate--alanine ligase